MYSNENFVFQHAVASIIADERLAYLNDIEPSEFERIVARNPLLRVALRKLLTIPSGLSTAQIAEELSRRTRELSESIPRHNKTLVAAAAEAGATSVAFATSSIAAVTGQTLGALAAIGLGAQLIVALRKWLNVPERSIIVQTFSDMQSQVLRAPLRTSLTFPSTTGTEEENVDDETRAALAQFRSEDWTEDRHKILDEFAARSCAQTIKVAHI
jgi:hypothetical protein